MSDVTAKDQERLHVAIFLSTYNGSQFLCEQLDSLLYQSHQNFRVYIRDDGSNDNTLEIIDRYLRLAPGKFTLLQGESGNLKPCASFSNLMESFLSQGCSADYFMFCDQDDIWLVDKISTSLRAIGAAKELDEKPVLVHAELEVVDATLKTIAPRLSQYQGLKPGHGRFGRSLINSSVTGCTMLFNRALLERSLPIPQGAIMHDWWMAVIAQAFGEVIFVDQVLIKYRQHDQNTLGAKEHSSGYDRLNLLKKLQLWVFERHDLSYVTRQVRALLMANGNNMRKSQKIIAYLSLCLDVPVGVIQRILYRFIRTL